jgi:hypothetical protein
MKESCLKKLARGRGRVCDPRNKSLTADQCWAFRRSLHVQLISLKSVIKLSLKVSKQSA